MEPIQGNVSIDAQNIMPIIKKWLYSDKDIFIREVVSNGCDAIMIDPITPDGSATALNKAVDAGIPVVIYDGYWTDGAEKAVTTVTWDQKATGTLIGEYFVNYVKEHNDGKARVVELLLLVAQLLLGIALLVLRRLQKLIVERGFLVELFLHGVQLVFQLLLFLLQGAVLLLQLDGVIERARRRGAQLRDRAFGAVRLQNQRQQHQQKRHGKQNCHVPQQRRFSRVAQRRGRLGLLSGGGLLFFVHYGCSFPRVFVSAS